MPRSPKVKCPCGCGQSPAATTRERRLECPACGYSIRVTRTWIVRGRPVCPCGAGELEATCLEDRALYDEAGAYDAWSARNGAKGLLESSGAASRMRGGPVDRETCKGCHRFLRHAHAVCKACGQDNGRDGWSTRLKGSSSASRNTEVPF